MPRDARERIRLQGVDALRGLAALWVALSHYLPHWNDRGGRAVILVPHAWGIHAVELFFVISGFVIFMTLEKCRTVRDFAILRFSRLYPAYWATLAFASLMGWAVWRQPLWPADLLANLTMFQEFLGYPDSDNVYWSLTAELAFYLHVSWIFALGWHKRPKRLALAWLALSAAWALWGHRPAEGRGGLALWFDFDFAPFFCMGMICYDALRNGWTPAGAAIVGLAIATAGLIHGPSGAAAACLCVLLFLGALRIRPDAPFLRPFLALGAFSYSFYLLHRNLGYASLDSLQARGLPAAAAVPLVLAGTLALGAVFWFGVERPSLAALRARWDRARRAGAGRALP